MVDHQPELHGDRELGCGGFSDHFSFRTERELHGDRDFGTSSPPLWKGIDSSSVESESSHLLSPDSRRRVVLDGRRELMKMVESLAESSYELSLKDLVENETDKDDRESADTEDKARIGNLKKQKSGSGRRAPITRTASMESEAIQIKMFFPSSLGLKKKPKVEKCSKAVSSKSPERSENRKEQDCRKTGFSVSRRNKIICRNSTSGSSTVPGCWSFLSCKKSNTSRETTHLLIHKQS